MQKSMILIDVLVINSPLFRDKIDEHNEDSLPPLGLGYIATNLSSNGIVVELLDAVENNTSIEEIVRIIHKKKPNYVAMNIFTTNQQLVREIVESVCKKVRFIIGGLATKSLYKNILSRNTNCKIDIVIGEGDFVVSAIVQERPLCIISENNDKRVITVPTNSSYFPRDISNINLDRSFFSNNVIKNVHGVQESSIVTSRGCIYNCAFCVAARSLNMDTPIRERNSRSVESELKMLHDTHNDIKSIRILDDLFLRNTDSVDRAVKIFCNLPFTWRAMAHILSLHKLSNEQLLELRKSGCTEIFVGIESGSARILKMIHKTSDTDLIKQTLDRLFCVGINVKGYFIFGFESESFEDMQMSFDLASQLKELSVKRDSVFRTSVFQFRPYDGTELHSKIIQKGGVVNNITQSEALSKEIGREQYNFSNGNFSEVSDDILREFIIKTNAINQ